MKIRWFDRFLIFFILLFFLVSCVSNETSTTTEISENLDQVCIKDNCFYVEIADTYDEREIGLMDRQELDTDKGMLFIFDQSDINKFWMKNTLIPLDMIWVDEQMQVIYVEKMALPCENDPCTIYGPNVASLYVLEINGGLADELEISFGDVLEINKE